MGPYASHGAFQSACGEGLQGGERSAEEAQSACGEGLYGAGQSAGRSEEERDPAAFERALQRLSGAVDAAAGREGSWLARLRAGVVAFLGFFDDEPGRGRLLIREAAVRDVAGGLGCERCVLGVLSSLLDDGAPQAIGELTGDPQLTGELLAGGVLSVVRACILEGEAHGEARPLVELAPELMAFIVTPYLGQAAAQAELAGMSAPAGETPPPNAVEPRDESLPVRATHRTMLVLRAISAAPHSSNRQVAQIAGLSDEGQASKLLSRLARRGVIENVGVGAPGGEPNAWTLTADGRRVLRLTGGVASAGSPRRRMARTSEQ